MGVVMCPFFDLAPHFLDASYVPDQKLHQYSLNGAGHFLTYKLLGKFPQQAHNLPQ